MKIETKDDTITTFISDPCFVSNSNQRTLEPVLSCETQENIGTIEGFDELPTTTYHNRILVEIEPGKTLNINPDLSESQTKQILDILQKHKHERDSCQFMHPSYIHQRGLSSYETTLEKDEPYSKKHYQGRTSKATGCGFYLSHFRQSMGFPIGDGS